MAAIIGNGMLFTARRSFGMLRKMFTGLRGDIERPPPSPDLNFKFPETTSEMCCQ